MDSAKGMFAANHKENFQKLTADAGFAIFHFLEFNPFIRKLIG